MPPAHPQYPRLGGLMHDVYQCGKSQIGYNAIVCFKSNLPSPTYPGPSGAATYRRKFHFKITGRSPLTKCLEPK